MSGAASPAKDDAGEGGPPRRTFFSWLFLPDGYPDSVAPEYARYQLWDTIQQVTYFVNTVISLQAVMKFHGVGNTHTNAAQATALSLSRGMLGQVVSLLFTLPQMTRAYKVHVVVFRLLSEVLSAVGHALEILAASFPVTALLYGGPMLLSTSGAMSGAARSVIMAHFAKVGNNGDVSLKESNQDRGGKIVGLIGGVLILAWIGMSSDSAAGEQASLRKSAMVFAVLSVVHILGNVAAVRSLDVPPPKPTAPAGAPAEVRGNAAGTGSARGTSVSQALKAWLLPPGWPASVADEYAAYHSWQAVCDLTNYPKSLVTQLFFWSNVYGVGDASKTPLDAVRLNIFMTGVDCIAGLVSGLPSVARQFHVDCRSWRFHSTVIGPVLGDTIYLLASMGPAWSFYPLIVLSVSLKSLANVSRKVVDAEIMRNWSRSHDVQLVHLTVAARNQSVLVQLVTASACLAYARRLASEGLTAVPSRRSLVALFLAAQVVKLASAAGAARSVPSPADQERAEEEARPGEAPPARQARSASAEFARPLLVPPIKLRRAHSAGSTPWGAGGDPSWAAVFDDLGRAPLKGFVMGVTTTGPQLQ